jgi:hypothetical protein
VIKGVIIHRVATICAASLTVILQHEANVPPLAKLALETHALGYPEGRDHAPLDCLPDFPAVSHVRRYSRQVSAACF